MDKFYQILCYSAVTCPIGTNKHLFDRKMTMASVKKLTLPKMDDTKLLSFKNELFWDTLYRWSDGPHDAYSSGF